MTKMHNPLRPFLLLLLLLPLPAAGGGHAAEARLSAPLGATFHPGNWLPISAQVSGVYGTFRPLLELRPTNDSRLCYTCTLPAQEIRDTARFSFPALTGNVALTARLVLQPADSQTAPATSPSAPPLALVPAPPQARVQIWAGTDRSREPSLLAAAPSPLRQSFTTLSALPDEDWLYENADLLILGSLSPDVPAGADRLTPRQCAAIGHWTGRGGIVIVLQRSLLDALVSHLPAELQAGPLQPFPLAMPPYPLERRCGLGRLILLDAARQNADPAFRVASIGLHLARALREQNLFQPRSGSPRFAPALYQAAGDWPPPPALAAYVLPALAGGWLIFASLALLLLRRRYAYALMTAPALLLLALPSLRPADGTVILQQLQLPAQEDQPAEARTLLLQPPFPGRAPAGGFPSQIPPRPLARTHAEIDGMECRLEKANGGWTFCIPSNRGQNTQILSSAHSVAPPAVTNLLARLSGSDCWLQRGAYSLDLSGSHVRACGAALSVTGNALPESPENNAATQRAIQRLLAAPDSMLPQERALLIFRQPPFYYAFCATAAQILLPAPSAPSIPQDGVAP